jgi:hypothetical protein
MKTSAIIFAIVAAALINISAAAETWDWFPISNNAVLHNMKYDGNQYLYYTSGNQHIEIWRFDLTTKLHQFVGNIAKGSTITDLTIDNNGNVWIIGHEMNLGSYPPTYHTYLNKYDGTQITYIDWLEPWEQNFFKPSFTQNTDKVCIASQGFILTITDNGIIADTLGATKWDTDSLKEKYPLTTLFISETDNFLIDDYLVWRNDADTIFMVNINDSSDYKKLAFADYQISSNDLQNISSIKVIDTSVYLLLSQFQDGYINGLIKLNGNLAQKLSFDNLTDKPFHIISDFVDVGKQRIYGMSIPNPDFSNYDFNENFEGKMMFYDSSNVLISSYDAPVLSFNGSPNKKGQPHRFTDITKIGNDIYCTLNNEHFGILKLSGITSIEEEWEYSFKKNEVWVYSIYPNITATGNNNILTVNFFCNPQYLDNLNVSVSDILGIQNFAIYSISAFNTSTGIGQMQLSIQNKLSIGTHFIILRANNDICVKGIIINK